MDINLHRHRITYFSTRLCILYPTIIPCNRTLYHNQQLALYYRITHHYTHRILHKTPTHQQKRQHKTIGAPAQRNATNISTCNASWGGALSTEKCNKHFYRQRKLGVGPSAQRNAPSISTDNASWGGPIIIKKFTHG